MNANQPEGIDPRAGFSLVELALALLVAGLGVVAVFNMFPQGLDASRRSVELSEVSVFAEFVFDSLQAQSLVNAPSNTWDSQFANNGSYAETQLSHAMAYVLGTQPTVTALGTGNPSDVQVYTVTPNYYQSFGGDASKYFAFSAFTYTLDIGTKGTATRYARLEVWPGDKRQAVQNANGKLPGSHVFYREYIPRYL